LCVGLSETSKMIALKSCEVDFSMLAARMRDTVVGFVIDGGYLALGAALRERNSMLITSMED